tara:strand:+ start:628 stop:1131 length:504 start_codon:yes stop_codon:yes gene_type:complete
MPDLNDLFIEVDSEGNAIEHPHHYKNLLDIYPDHDFSTGVPSKYEPFKKVKRPELVAYQRLVDHDAIGAATDEYPEYIKVDGSWQENWVIIPFTAEEKKRVQDEVKEYWAETAGKVLKSWVYNETRNDYEAPIPMPEVTDEERNAGKGYTWNEETVSWDEVWEDHDH